MSLLCRGARATFPSPQRGWGRVGIIGLLSVAMLLVGCKSHYVIPVEELKTLDGFEWRETRGIADNRGRIIEFTRETPVLLILRSRPKIYQTFHSIRVREGLFEGKSQSGGVISVRLDEIHSVYVTQGRPLKTAMIALSIVTGVALFALLAWLWFTPAP